MGLEDLPIMSFEELILNFKKNHYIRLKVKEKAEIARITEYHEKIEKYPRYKSLVYVTGIIILDEGKKHLICSSESYGKNKLEIRFATPMELLSLPVVNTIKYYKVLK